MNKEGLLKRVNELFSQRDIISVDNAEELLDNYLINNPNDADMWLRLAVIQLYAPLNYYPKAIECIYRVFELNSNNVEAHLLYAYINHFHYPANYEGVAINLSNIKTEDTEKLSMIEYAKSWSYMDNLKDACLYEKALKKSIQLHPYHAWNYIDLGRFYI